LPSTVRQRRQRDARQRDGVACRFIGCLLKQPNKLGALQGSLKQKKMVIWDKGIGLCGSTLRQPRQRDGVACRFIGCLLKQPNKLGALQGSLKQKGKWGLGTKGLVCAAQRSGNVGSGTSQCRHCPRIEPLR
jgi:hypothetical protein